MKKVYSLIIFIAAVFISLQAMAMEHAVLPMAGMFDSLLKKSADQIKSFRGGNGENIFHVMFDRFQKSGGTDAALNAQIVDCARRFPDLLLIPDNDGQFATDLVEGTLLPLDVYGILAERFKVSLYNPAYNLETEKFMRDVAPSLLATIARGLMGGDEASLSVKAKYSKIPAEKQKAQEALAILKNSTAVYDNFVINGSRGLLRITPKGMGIPLYMVPVDCQRQDFIERLFKNEDAFGINVFTDTLFKHKLDTEVLKFINLANKGYSGLYAAFQKGEGYFDRFFTEIRAATECNAPEFLDYIVYAMSQVGYQKDGITPVVSQAQLAQLLGAYPGLREKIKRFPNPLGGLEAYFDEDIKSHRVHILLSRPRKMGESFDSVGFVTDAVSKGQLRLPDYLMSDFAREGNRTFVDYFRAASEHAGHNTVNPDFWDYLYSNPYFNYTRENSAVRAFLIGLNMSMHKVNITTIGPDDRVNLELFRKGGISSLIDKNDTFTGQEPTTGISKAARVMRLMSRANQYVGMYGIEVEVRDKWGRLTSPPVQEVISNEILDTMGGFSPTGLNLNRKATQDEFLTAMDALRDIIEREVTPTAFIKTKMATDAYSSSIGAIDRKALKRHREALLLCAEWMDLEKNTRSSEIDRIKMIAASSSLRLSADDIKNRLYRMEDNFNVPGFFIRNRVEIDTHLHDD